MPATAVSGKAGHGSVLAEFASQRLAWNASMIEAGMRPRSDTSCPFLAAHSRIA
jgi:hypothetical protein